MGGSSKPPKAPDPLPAAQATAQANKDVAMYTTAMDRPTQIDPYGTTTWTYSPAPQQLTEAQKAAQATYARYQAIVAGQAGSAKDRQWLTSNSKGKAQMEAARKAAEAVGGTPGNPRPGEWVQKTTLSPAEQAIYDKDVRARKQAYDLGNSALTSAQQAGAGGQLNMAGLQGVNALSGPNLFYAGTPLYQKGTMSLPQLQSGSVNLPYLQASQTGLPQWQNLAGNVPQWAGMGQYGNVPQAQRLSGQAPEWAGMQGDMPQFEGSQVGLPENYYDQFQNQLAGMQDVNTSSQMFAQQGDQVRNALYEQMTQFSNQRYQQEEEALRQNLANQGFAIGSEGFNRELEAFRRQKDESYRAAELNSILAGGSEQSRLYADMLAGTQSNIGRRATQSQLDLARMAGQQGAAGDIYGLGLQERQAAYGAEMAGRGQQFAESQFGFSADMAQRQQMEQELQNYYAQQMQTRGQQFGESQYGFDAAMLNRQQQLYENQAGFDARSQTYGLDLQNRQAMQQAQLDAYNADMMNRGMTFDANVQRYGMDEATRLQNYQTDMQSLNSIVARQQQGFQNQAQVEQWNAMMRDQQIQERMLQRQIPMNEALALAGMTGVTNPAYQPFNLSQPWQGVDYLGAQNQQYQNQINQANYGSASQGQTYGLLGSLAMAGATYF